MRPIAKNKCMPVAAVVAALLSIPFLTAPVAFGSTASVLIETRATTSAGDVSAAVESTTTASTTPRFQERKEVILERVAEVKDELRQKREEWNEERAELQTELRIKVEAGGTALAEAAADRRSALLARIEAWRETMREKRKIVMSKLDADARARAQAYLDSTLRRFEVIAEGLDRTDARIGSYIETAMSGGLDTQESSRLLAEARIKLETAKEDTAEVKVLLGSELDKETSKESLKAHIKAAKDSLKEAHEAYVEVLRSLKAGRGSEANATTSSSL